MELIKQYESVGFVPTQAQLDKLDALMKRFKADRVTAMKDIYDGWMILDFASLKDGEWKHFMTVGVGPEGDSHT